ncbi:MAG TPA: YbhB/YbcL family Raf kinase inhibitor-like protein [Sedimenticola thiotaurini]|uniref:YbhB/YbcL family Raf kinase inhibitor-like protein n=1 Tax=Sedimenticola thiotaurini TaxID=1543721 RepID=A0A831RQW0_9GAMM|nr:YbhB/YbcL family Raf kinase inhibitor-like protein [Sedimenticola thiotaurini]
MSLTLRSPAFAAGEPIPQRYTCEGDDISPPLEWSGVPAGTRSLALVVDDPDAPDPAAPRMTWVHWLVYDLPPDSGGLQESVAEREFPPGTRLGRNDFRRTRYGGPCPPIGTHRYFFKLYALDTVLPDLAEPDKAALLRAMEGHVLERAELMGTYRKQR